MGTGDARGRGFTLIEMMVTVAIVGVLAAMAIPAFTRYIRKSQSAEARTFVRKIYDGARQYYLQSTTMPKTPWGTVGSVANMQMADAQYPGVVDPVELSILGGYWDLGRANASCCVVGGADQKCQPDVTLWTTLLWQSLHFSVDDPAFYAYEYRPDTGALDAPHNFTAIARGDLDCDADRSTFLMYGFDDPSYADGPLGTGQIKRLNEWE